MKISKKIITILSSLIILVWVFSINIYVNAISNESFYYLDDSNYLTYSISDGKATITSCMCGGEIIIPEEIDGYPVTAIGYRAFHLSEMITNISLPDSLITIEDEAFAGCKMLKSLVIPQNVQSIGSHAIGYDFVATSISVGEKYYDFTLIGYENTIAETYANNNGFTFTELDNKVSTTTTTTTTSGINVSSGSTSTLTSKVSQNTATQTTKNTMKTTSDVPLTTIDQKRTVTASNLATPSPKTGDLTPITAVLSAFSTVTIAAVLLRKKKK